MVVDKPDNSSALKSNNFTSRYTHTEDKMTLSIKGFILSFVILCVCSMPSVASAKELATDDEGSSFKRTISTSSVQQSANNHLHSNQESDKPSNTKSEADNLTEYVKSKIDNFGKAKPESNVDSLRPTQIESHLKGDYNEAYYEVSELNSGLPNLVPPPNLETPLATLEFFNTAILQKDFALASYALNLNPIESQKQSNVAPDLAKKLDYLLNEKNLYVFDDMPDRSDGLVEPIIGDSNPIKGIPRRSIKLGEIDFKNRKVPLYIERVKTDEGSPVWVFSAQTVVNIDGLYDLHKPPDFEGFLPHWLTKKLFGMSVWEGLVLLIYMLLTLGLGYIVSKVVSKLVEAYTITIKSRSDNDQLSIHNRGLTDLFSKIVVPLTTTISFGLMFALVSGALPTVHSIATSTRPFIWLGLVFSCLWFGIRIINFISNRYHDLQIDSLNEEEFNKQRVRMTYLSVFRKIFIFVMVLGGLWISLAEFADLEGLGKTILTSAGIAGAVIGIAAQPTLGNIIAGFQVALTQPIRIGDTVMMDGIWTEVEDLRYTYAVLKTWDDRRLIVPMKYFVTEILENWSHTDDLQSSAIYIYLDYGADIDAISEKFVEIVKAHELWEKGSEPNILVTDVSEKTIKIRCKVTSNSPANAWQLECDVRKLLLDYLSEHQPEYLPTQRITLSPR